MSRLTRMMRLHSSTNECASRRRVKSLLFTHACAGIFHLFKKSKACDRIIDIVTLSKWSVYILDTFESHEFVRYSPASLRVQRGDDDAEDDDAKDDDDDVRVDVLFVLFVAFRGEACASFRVGFALQRRR